MAPGKWEKEMVDTPYHGILYGRSLVVAPLTNGTMTCLALMTNGTVTCRALPTNGNDAMADMIRATESQTKRKGALPHGFDQTTRDGPLVHEE